MFDLVTHYAPQTSSLTTHNVIKHFWFCCSQCYWNILSCNSNFFWNVLILQTIMLLKWLISCKSEFS